MLILSVIKVDYVHNWFKPSVKIFFLVYLDWWNIFLRNK